MDSDEQNPQCMQALSGGSGLVNRNLSCFWINTLTQCQGTLCCWRYHYFSEMFCHLYHTLHSRRRQRPYSKENEIKRLDCDLTLEGSKRE